MKKREKPVIYYTDELTDEFSTAKIVAKTIDGTYDYEGGFLRKAGRILFYHILAKPVAWVFLKVKFGHRVVGGEVLKKYKSGGYFLYGNHTNAGADALIPTMISPGRSVYVIVHPNNVSMPVFGKITPSLGALPLPDTKDAMKHFHSAIRNLVKKGNTIAIYPEAHIWPYYTGIRPFKKDSFGYPIQCKVPVFCFTNTYQKRRFFRTPRIVTYVNGPFYAQEDLSLSEQKEQLRRLVYDTMVENSRHNTVEMISYRKKEG